MNNISCVFFAQYCTLLLVTFVLLAAGIGLLYTCEHMVVGGMETNLAEGLQSYSIDPNVTEEIDYLQQSVSIFWGETEFESNKQTMPRTYLWGFPGSTSHPK